MAPIHPSYFLLSGTPAADKIGNIVTKLSGYQESLNTKRSILQNQQTTTGKKKHESSQSHSILTLMDSCNINIINNQSIILIFFFCFPPLQIIGYVRIRITVRTALRKKLSASIAVIDEIQKLISRVEMRWQHYQ